MEVRTLARDRVPGHLPEWAAWSTDLAQWSGRFLIDGMVACTWDARLRGRTVLTLTARDPIAAGDREELEREGELLLAWLRPDTDRREVRWATS